VETGSPISSGAVSFSAAFGKCLSGLAEKDPRIIAITAAMKEGTGLTVFLNSFLTASMMSASQSSMQSLLLQDLQQVVSDRLWLFTQRFFSALMTKSSMMSACKKLPVVFAVDRCGFVGEDGPTHHGLFDISYLRHIPNLTVSAPKIPTN